MCSRLLSSLASNIRIRQCQCYGFLGQRTQHTVLEQARPLLKFSKGGLDKVSFKVVLVGRSLALRRFVSWLDSNSRLNVRPQEPISHRSFSKPGPTVDAFVRELIGMGTYQSSLDKYKRLREIAEKCAVGLRNIRHARRGTRECSSEVDLEQTTPVRSSAPGRVPLINAVFR